MERGPGNNPLAQSRYITSQIRKKKWAAHSAGPLIRSFLLVSLKNKNKKNFKKNKKKKKFQGPPGTGKTFVALQLMKAFLDNTKELIRPLNQWINIFHDIISIY